MRMESLKYVYIGSHNKQRYNALYRLNTHFLTGTYNAHAGTIQSDVDCIDKVIL